MVPSLSLAVASIGTDAGAVKVDPSGGWVRATDGAAFVVFASAARYTFRRPPDATRPGQGPTRSTLPSSSDLTALTDRLGCCAMRSAAEPATCGAAMLVPVALAYPE